MRTKLIVTLLLLLAFVPACFKRSSNIEPPPAASPVPSKSPFPQQNGLINDFANVLDADAKSRIQPILDALSRDLDVEFAVVTVDTTGPLSAHDYSLALSREWKVGKSGKGLLYLLAIKDRQWRIQVSTALEQALPNEVCAKLHEPSLKLLKEEKYGDAIANYVRAIDHELRKKK